MALKFHSFFDALLETSRHGFWEDFGTQNDRFWKIIFFSEFVENREHADILKIVLTPKRKRIPRASAVFVFVHNFVGNFDVKRAPR